MSRPWRLSWQSPPEDALLTPLRDGAGAALTAVVGMPIRLAPGAGVSIAALVLGADGRLRFTPSSICIPAKRWRLSRGGR